jgi:hypothetical protein
MSNKPDDRPMRLEQLLSEIESEKLVALIDARDKWRQEVMPDERTAILMMFEAWQRLMELGWKNAKYAPADGRPLELLEIGSTGIHKGFRETNKPSPFPVKRFYILDGDAWPSDPVLYREPNESA